MATVYSTNYALAPDNTNYVNILSPSNTARGNLIVIYASVTFPAGSAAADIGVFAPLSAGVRPVGTGLIKATATNGSLTATLGYTSSVAALRSSITTEIQSATTTALFTVAQLSGISTLPVAGDNLILTLAGTFSNATTVTLMIPFANCGA